ncbi:MAG TPA: hypothetical protein VFY82_02565 [Acidimicrobiales bacterium]|nr:hypothetical protein [Acidimicrobiales bacterium]
MPIRAWMLRRLMGRLRITDDAVRHLSTFQRLGEDVEVELPSELMPVGARTVFRALRTRSAAQIGPDWVWPYWLERQLDPTSPAFVPRGHLPFLTNVTQRNWTPVGNLDSPWEAIVDPRGLVTPWYDGWSLDWWIGGDDRWHLPSREVGVRQRLIGASPVVETAMSIPSGDAVQRVYAVQRSSSDGGGEMVVVEVENRSKAPVALALAVRPYTPEGLSVIERIDLRGSTVAVDGRVALLLPKPPMRVAGSTFHDGDSAATVLSGAAAERWGAPVRDRAGLAQAAFVYPLAHGATFRVAIPLDPEARTRRAGLTHRRLTQAPAFPDVLPPAEAVAKGWQAQTDRGMRLVLPDDRLAEAVAASRRYLLLLHDGEDITPGPATYHRFWFRDAAYLLGALDHYGHHDEVAQVLRSYPGRQRTDGFFFSQTNEWDANGAALVTLARHWRLTRDAGLVEGMVGPIAKAVHWIDKKRRAAKGKRKADPAVTGLLPAGVSAEHLGPFDHFYWDDFWGVAGLWAGAELLRAIAQPDAADDADRFARAMWSDVEASLALTAERLGTPAIPAGPRRRVDSGAIGSLAACAPLGLLPPDDERIAATADALRERFTLADGRAFYQGISHSGLGTYLTMQLAAVELRAGDRRSLDRLAWLLEVATPTWTWPEAIHPRLDGGCMGDGHHGWASAELLMFVRDLLVREVPPAELPGDGTDEDVLALSTLVPEDWFGQGWEVHDAPTAFGTISYAVRWHGDRVALLWEVEPHPGQGPIRLVSPGLDPTWSTTDLRGEALLGPVPAPAPTPPDDAAATHDTPPAPGADGTIGTATAVSITRSGSGARSPEGGSFT